MIGQNQIKRIFQDVVKKYKKFGFDLSNVKLQFSMIPITTDGTISTKISIHEYGGCWTKQSIIFINPVIEEVIKYYNKDKQLTQKDILINVEQIIAHELAHEVYNKCTDDYKTQIINEAIKMNFNTVYLKHRKLSQQKYKEELFCEYLSYSILGYIKGNK